MGGIGRTSRKGGDRYFQGRYAHRLLEKRQRTAPRWSSTGRPPTTVAGPRSCRRLSSTSASMPSIGAVVGAAETPRAILSSGSSRTWPRWWTPSGSRRSWWATPTGCCAPSRPALIASNVRKLVLYEPAMDVTDERINPPGVVDQLEALLEAGDRDEVVATMLREVAGVPPEAVENMRSLPAWEARVAAGAHDPAGTARSGSVPVRSRAVRGS